LFRPELKNSMFLAHPDPLPWERRYIDQVEPIVSSLPPSARAIIPPIKGDSGGEVEFRRLCNFGHVHWYIEPDSLGGSDSALSGIYGDQSFAREFEPPRTIIYRATIRLSNSALIHFQSNQDTFDMSSKVLAAVDRICEFVLQQLSANSCENRCIPRRAQYHELIRALEAVAHSWDQLVVPIRLLPR
jgi:hypothetical protein